jgi:hypothetical protein
VTMAKLIVSGTLAPEFVLPSWNYGRDSQHA